MLKTRLLLVIGLLLSGCGSPGNPTTISQTRAPINPTTTHGFLVATPNWINPIYLSFGETFLLSNGTQISFSEVISDNRCVPSDQNCQQPGNAEIRLTIKFSDGQTQIMRLYTRPDLSHNAWVRGVSIELLKVLPEPPTKPEKNEYQIWIRVLLI